MAPSDSQLNEVAKQAAIGGHTSLLNSILDRMPDNYLVRWDVILEGAVEGGHKHIVNHILSLIPNDQIDWQGLAESAVWGKDEDMIHHIISKAPVDYSWNLNRLAAFSSNQTKFDFVLSLPNSTNLILDWNHILQYKVDNYELFNHVLSLIPSNYPIDWQTILQAAMQNDETLAMPIYIIGIAPVLDYNDAFVTASLQSTSHNFDCILQTVREKLMKEGQISAETPNENLFDWQTIMEEILDYNIDHEVLDHIYKLTGNYDYDWEKLENIISLDHDWSIL